MWLDRPLGTVCPSLTCDLSCKDMPHPGRLPLTLAPQLQTFLRKFPFTSARVIANHFLMTVLTIQNILQRELGMEKFTRHWCTASESRLKSFSGWSIKRDVANTKETNLMELWQATNSGFEFSIHALKCLQNRQEKSFRGCDRQSVRSKLWSRYSSPHRS